MVIARQRSSAITAYTAVRRLGSFSVIKTCLVALQDDDKHKTGEKLSET